jgi:hypothetical protein
MTGRLAPGAQVQGIQPDAEDIRRDETELGGPQTDEAQNHAIDCRQKPTFPATLANQDCGTDSENA